MFLRPMPKMVINPSALWKTLWNLLILVLILFMGVSVPYRIPFEDQTSDSWVIADTFFDLIFITDIVLNFLTAYEDENGELVTEKKKIFKTYIKSWFIIDLISSIPITLISRFLNDSGLNNMKLIKLSRLPRLYRLLRLIKLMRLYR